MTFTKSLSCVFESMHNNKYVKAYMENVKPVIIFCLFPTTHSLISLP